MLFLLLFIMFSTSGVHGTYETLDEIEHIIKHGKYTDGTPYAEGEDEGRPLPDLTVLIIHPRTVVLKYGNIIVETLDEVKFLRKLVKEVKSYCCALTNLPESILEAIPRIQKSVRQFSSPV